MCLLHVADVVILHRYRYNEVIQNDLAILFYPTFMANCEIALIQEEVGGAFNYPIKPHTIPFPVPGSLFK